MRVPMFLMLAVAVLVLGGVVLIAVVASRSKAKNAPAHRPPGAAVPTPGTRPGPPGRPPPMGASRPGPPPAGPAPTPQPRSRPAGDLATRATALRDAGRESDAILLVCDETGMAPDAARAFVAALPSTNG